MPGRSSAKSRKWIARIGILCGAAIAGITYIHFTYGPTSFDPVLWRSGETADFDDSAPRLRMADGLIESGALLGETKQHIDAMLGPPTKTDKFAHYDRVYWLGAERSFFGLDSEWLVIRFGGEKVVEARNVRD